MVSRVRLAVHRRSVLRGMGALVALSLVLPLGCGREDDVDTPPTIRYGQDVCVRCGMIISDPAYAAAYRTAGGETRLFDDLGEMVLHNRQQSEATTAVFVHSYETRDWLRAEEAYFVVSSGLRTPMGVGVAAVGTEAEATQLAARVQGAVMTFDELMKVVELPASGGHSK